MLSIREAPLGTVAGAVCSACCAAAVQFDECRDSKVASWRARAYQKRSFEGGLQVP